MAIIQQAVPVPVYSAAKPYQVLSMTDVRLKAARYTDGSARENVLLALFFGTDTSTGKPNVIIMNPDKIQDAYVVPSPTIRDGLLRLLDEDSGAVPNLPEGVPSTVVPEEVKT